MSDRPHDLLLYGATGFTGRLVLEYLLQNAPTTLRLAMAGRSPEKLSALRRELQARFPRAGALEIRAADAQDASAVRALAESARVLVTTVGPYARYGEGVVAACAAAGTHYADLTGEVHFVRRMIDLHEAEARRTGARLVHACGFDSIPSDLGCLMMCEALSARGVEPESVKMLVLGAMGGASGGSAATAVSLFEAMSHDPGLARLLSDPYVLCPEGSKGRPPSPDKFGVGFERELDAWTAPFVMGPINSRIVFRSQALLHPEWTSLMYSEAVSMGRGPLGLARAVAMSAGIQATYAALGVDLLRRRVIPRFLPKPGEGPTKEERERGSFTIRFYGSGRDRAGARASLRGLVRGEQDPGYGETAKMLGESGLCLALDAAQLPVEGGSWTPATAMGQRLIDRLRAARMTFEVSET